ncbi:MAG: DUF1648 domain-containing protein, partial [Gemmatimonadales bacterium]
PMDTLHTATFRLNSILYVAFLGLAWGLWERMPDRYPGHMSLGGEVTRWAEGPGEWILLVALCSITFGKMHLFQRFVVVDPDTQLLNVPHKKAFQRLPRERRIPVIRRANRMLGFLNSGTLATFALLMTLVYLAATHPGSITVPLANGALILVLVLLVVIPVAEALAMGRMIRRKLEEEGIPLTDSTEGDGHSHGGSTR